MEQALIDKFVKKHRKKFSDEQLDSIKIQLGTLSDDMFEKVMNAGYKKVGGMSWIAWLFGDFGVDRFMLGDIKGGIIMLLLCWSTIPWFISWWTIDKRTRKYNYAQFEKAIM